MGAAGSTSQFSASQEDSENLSSSSSSFLPFSWSSSYSSPFLAHSHKKEAFSSLPTTTSSSSSFCSSSLSSSISPPPPPSSVSFGGSPSSSSSPQIRRSCLSSNANDNIPNINTRSKLFSSHLSSISSSPSGLQEQWISPLSTTTTTGRSSFLPSSSSLEGSFDFSPPPPRSSVSSLRRGNSLRRPLAVSIWSDPNLLCQAVSLEGGGQPIVIRKRSMATQITPFSNFPYVPSSFVSTPPPSSLSSSAAAAAAAASSPGFSSVSVSSSKEMMTLEEKQKMRVENNNYNHLLDFQNDRMKRYSTSSSSSSHLLKSSLANPFLPSPSLLTSENINETTSLKEGRGSGGGLSGGSVFVFGNRVGDPSFFSSSSLPPRTVLRRRCQSFATMSSVSPRRIDLKSLNHWSFPSSFSSFSSSSASVWRPSILSIFPSASPSSFSFSSSFEGKEEGGRKRRRLRASDIPFPSSSFSCQNTTLTNENLDFPWSSVLGFDDVASISRAGFPRSRRITHSAAAEERINRSSSFSPKFPRGGESKEEVVRRRRSGGVVESQLEGNAADVIVVNRGLVENKDKRDERLRRKMDIWTEGFSRRTEEEEEEEKEEEGVNTTGGAVVGGEGRRGRGGSCSGFRDVERNGNDSTTVRRSSSSSLFAANCSNDLKDLSSLTSMGKSRGSKGKLLANEVSSFDEFARQNDYKKSLLAYREFIRQQKLKEEKLVCAVEEADAKDWERYERLEEETLRAVEKIAVGEEKPSTSRVSRMRCTQEDVIRAQSFFDPRKSGSDILTEKFNIEMTREVLSCLSAGCWLNDEVINFYIDLLQERNTLHLKNEENVPRVYFFNTFFYDKLKGAEDPSISYDYKGVRRWTKRKNVDIFMKDLVLLPVHYGKVHWALGVLDFRARRVMFMDSLGHSFEQFHKHMLRYIQDEHMDKKGCPLPESEKWAYLKSGKSVRTPQQMNCSDCGVFMCQFAECLGDGRPFDFTQDDIPEMRMKMAVQIVDGKVD